MKLSVNNTTLEVASVDQLQSVLVNIGRLEFREIWLSAPDGQSLCALLNREVGWLMYLPAAGDAGFRSRNPAFSGSESVNIECRLNNGQVDAYPASWAISEVEILRALSYFVVHVTRPPFVEWQNDSDQNGR
jgi:hypothetical protein